MSGGRPSSIKRCVLCAAASLHIYVPEFFVKEVGACIRLYTANGGQ